MEIITYKGENPGPILLIIGAVHGNEKAGTIAIRKFQENMGNGCLSLSHGVVLCVPIANQKAYDDHVRYCDQNMNRMFGMQNKDCIESKPVHALEQLINSADIVLDLHTNHTGNMPFVFVDREEQTEEVDRALSLKSDMYVYGRKKIYNEYGGTTSEYAHRQGKLSITVECGSHNSPQSPLVGYDYIIKTLEYFKYIANHHYCGYESSVSKHIKAKDIIYKGDPSYVLSKDIEHGDIMTYKGEEITVLLPFHSAQEGDERFYIGVEK